MVYVAGSLLARIRISSEKITEFSPHPYALFVRDLCGDLEELVNNEPSKIQP